MQLLSVRLTGALCLLLATVVSAEETKIDLAAELRIQSAKSAYRFTERHFNSPRRQELVAVVMGMIADDPDPQNRLLAFHVWQQIGRLQAQKLPEAIRETLKSNQPLDRDLLIASVIDSGDRGIEFLPQLVRLDAQDPNCRSGIITTSQYFGTLSDRLLRSHADHADADVRAYTVVEFARRASEGLQNTAKVRESLFHHEPQRRYEAVRAHECLALNPHSDTQIVAMLNDKCGPVCRVAMEYLGSRPVNHRETVIAGLNHSDAAVRRAAAASLAKLPEPKDAAQKELRRVINEDVNPLVAREATRSLITLGERSDAAVPAIVRRLRECQDPEARRLYVSGLAAIGPAAQAAVPTLRAMIADSEHPQLMVERALWKITGDPDALVEVIRASFERDVRELKGAHLVDSAVDIARELGPAAKPLVPLLAAHLRQSLACPPAPEKAHEWSRSRADSVRALQAVGPDAKEALESLELFRQSEHPNSYAKEAAAEAIAAIRGETPPQP